MSMRKRRSFTEEFKAEAVSLVLDQGMSASQVARDLDLTLSSLRSWVEQAKADRGEGGLTTDEKEELRRLRRENRELKMEREILKKAAAFFAKESK
jgi:transposase